MQCFGFGDGTRCLMRRWELGVFDAASYRTYHWVRVAAGGQREVHQRLRPVHGEALQLVLVPGFPFRVEQQPKPLEDPSNAPMLG